MWWGSGPDPGNSGGEGSKEPPQSQQLVDLQEQFEQQQAFIAQLKEMLRKTEQSSSVSREKVEEYASTLSEINARAKLSKMKRSEGRKSDQETSSSKSSTTVASSSKKSAAVTPAKERINLLRQQLEENRVKLAERDKNQKDMADMVNQLKAQLDESQATIHDPPIIIPKTESETITTIYSPETSKDDLLFAIKSKDDHIMELTGKVQQLQANVLDLQENVKEKDSVIDARTKAITLLSENLSKKGKDTLDMLEDTKVQMRNMQQNFVTLESKMKEENIKLQSELVVKDNRIHELTEINNALETNNCELQQKLTIFSGSENKIIELNKLIEELQIRIRESEDSSRISPEKIESTSPQKTSKRKGSKKFKTKETAETKNKETIESKIKEPVESSSQVPESTHLNRIFELEKLVEELTTKQEELKSADVTDSDEVAKLNKQLEEMNKNMIKMKAQHKAKLKEVQKKTSPNELIEKVTSLESENVKLGQQVAELEDEKGNLQLRLVDYESNKEKEYIADLENKIEEQKMEIENHIRTITTLEFQITTSSNELSALRSELANMLHIENAQVCSEMTSVQLEEQLDKEVSQKKEIQDKFNEIVRENENLLEKIETINKEKQEISSKLDQYMQENIELIDRLEKLSAEKVSSAESIEIVDALTHQEKLEIEAYQKNLDFDKPTDENIDEHNQDLNDSVSKLNEETSELMEKIKLFTVERREVMEKMDNLNAENQQLNSKLEKYEKEKSELDEKYKELCHEKDSLLSKIDQLLSEKEELNGKLKEKSNDQPEEKIQEELIEYRAIIENQKIQIASLQEDLWNKSDNEAEKSSTDNKLTELNESLNSQLRTLQAEYESLYTINESTKEQSKELINATNKITELEDKIAENIEEIAFLQGQIETNKEELIKASERIVNDDKHLTDQNAKIESLEYESEQLHKTIEDLSNELEEKEKSKNDTVSSLSSQLSELKTIIAENFEQLEQYETEINKNSQTSEELHEKLEELNYKIVETEHITEIKNLEINTLKQEKSACETKINNLEEKLKEKDDKFAETCLQLNEKCKFLENQIKTNTGSIDNIKGPFEAKITQLETKNKEQVDKMKKIAANLKKKSNICQELETKLAEVEEKLVNVTKDRDVKENLLEKITKSHDSVINKLEDVRNQIEAEKHNLVITRQEIDNLRKNTETEFKALQENLNKEIEEKNQLIQNLNLELNTIKSESKTSNDQMIQNLEEQLETLKINHETSKNAMEAKLQEKDLFIENLEADNVKSKERVEKLEEGLSIIEERRQHLEQTAFDLSIQLDEKSSVCEEVSQSGDFLERRLSALVAHDEIIERKLEQSTTENQSLTEKVKSLTEENDALQQKIIEINLKLQENIENVEKIEFFENEVSSLRTIISSSENEIKKLQSEYERVLKEKNNEIENMEAELNSQLQVLHAERKSLLNQCEVLQDNVKEYAENHQLLTYDMDQLKEMLSKTKQQLDETILESQQYYKNNEIYIVKIEDLENKLTSLQHTTGGEQDTQTLKIENDRLQNIIIQKDNDIQNYQRQNMQLQMAGFSSAPPSIASFFTAPEPQIEIINADNNKQYDILEQEVSELRKKVSSSDNELLCAKDKIEELESHFIASQSAIYEKNIQIDKLEEKVANQQELERLHQISQNELKEKNILITNLEQELQKQKEILIRKTAEEGIEQIISTAEKTLSENEKDTAVSEELFQKQEVKDAQAILESPLVEITKEELLRKIKALEFMLFNVEKEKDDTIVQCHEYTNELARLVYEREKLITDKPPRCNKSELDIQSLEGQIVSDSEVNNSLVQSKDLQALEFSPLQMQANKENIPVSEEIIESKTAYLCYSDDIKDQKNLTQGWGTEDSKIQESIESQILQIDATKITPEDKKQLELMEFGQINIPKDTQDHTTPVSDNIPDPKHAYLCYPTKTKNIEKSSENLPQSEAWGWGTEDSKMQQLIDSQILQIDATKITPEDKKQLELMEFGQINIPKDTQDHTTPVSDNIPDPKHAYLCYPSEKKNIDKNSSENLPQGEAWGWGTEDSKMQQLIDSQILQIDATKITPEDKKQFELMQYGQVNIPKDTQDHATPVSDNIPDPKHAYLCYPSETKDIDKKSHKNLQDQGENWGIEDSKIEQSIDSQILQIDATKITPEDKKQFELMQFGQVNIPKDPQDHTIPVSDNIPDPKYAYVCYPTETKNILAEDTFAGEEDGWGWNAEEAKLEAEHRMTLSTAQPSVDSRVEQLEERIHDLEVERSRLLEEIKSSQVRSGKLIKKLKLMKEKNDSLVAEVNKKTSGDFSLEMAIQDELTTQIKTLEKKIKELSEENFKEKTERENLYKKVEVITNANDRMIEMKEKQDNELQFLQFKNRELSSKLEQLEWGDDSPNRSKTPTIITTPVSSGSDVDNTQQKKQNEELNKKIAELNSIINDLTLDNEEMQCMIEEQRNMRREAEKALSNCPVQENMKSEQEFLKVESENRNLHEELTKLNDVWQVLENKFTKAESENKNLQEEIQKLNDTRQVLEDKISQNVIYSNDLEEKSNNLQLNIQNLVQENQLLNNQYSAKIEQLQNENIELQNQLTNMSIEKENILQNQVDPIQITQLQNENVHLQNQLSNLNIEKETLLKEQMDANIFETIQLKTEITRLEEENRRLESLLSEKEQNLQNFSVKIQLLEEEKNSVETRLQEILNIQSADHTNDDKLQQMNEQLMSVLTNLDSKNKEIVELNNALSNERLDSEQKLSSTIEQLAQQWAERVDQRGNDVAESWKLHLESVENEFSQKEENLRGELNNLFKQNEELLSQNNTLQQQVHSLLSEKQTFVSDNNNTIESLQQTVNNKQTEISELLENVKNKETEILNMSQTVTTKETEILHLSHSAQNKETEILELSENIKNKESELLELSKKLQEISSELQLKNSEIINLQLTFEQTQSKEIEYQNYVQQYAQQLEEKTVQCNDLEEKLNELNSFSQEEQKEISDLKKMIENQVLKIEDLKKDIEQKDAEYNVLAAEFDKIEASLLRPEEKQQIIKDLAAHQQNLNPDNVADLANRAELDLALYMLHQRDVRCEELTVELMQLLEERDTLQLKLSNAIRLNEELRSKMNVQSPDISSQESPISVKSTGAIPKSKSTAIVLGATGTELATEATENINTDTTPKDADELANKLSQLHSVGYNRDKTLKDDQQSRHIQQMTIMQQHRDLAANLPPEAAARLLDASYTVSRDVQSPSKVLLNWLWGRSTPKVNDV